MTSLSLSGALAAAAQRWPERFKWTMHAGGTTFFSEDRPLWMLKTEGLKSTYPQPEAYLEYACREQCKVLGWTLSMESLTDGRWCVTVMPDAPQSFKTSYADSPAFALLLAMLAAAEASA